MKTQLGTAILVGLLILSHILHATAAQPIMVPLDLNCIVYQDGAVHVTYRLQVNQTVPTVNVTLFGSLYENIIIVDENDTFLDYTLHNNVLIVHSLGASIVTLDCDILDLTNKTKGIWTLSLSSPINFTVTFPVNTTIIDLSTVPLEILSQEHQTRLTMSPGAHYISYIISTLTPQEEVRELLDLVAIIITQIKLRGIDTSTAEDLLNQAETAYTQGAYMEANDLVNHALTLALALKANPFTLTLPLVILLTCTLLGILALLMYRRKTRIDVDAIFQRYPWLREDQKEVIRFLAKHRTGVFEAQLRQMFHVPKSSMWRLVKKLEAEGILTITLRRRQNFIQLRKR